MRGLFVNTERELCSIYESGFAAFKILSKSSNFTLEYCEVSAEKNSIDSGFDFYIFNYHWVQMKWLDTELLKKKLNRVYTIVLEVEPRNPFFRLSPTHFDGYLVLDPTCGSVQENVVSFPRPLIDLKPIRDTSMHIASPIIGSFGLGYADKGFDELILAVEKEFDQATIRINLPFLDSMPESEKVAIESKILSYSLKPNVKIEITSIIMGREELVEWCSRNDLNAFFYTRRIGNGLSATTDQAIAAGVPLAISTNPTFRHIMEYVKPYPFMNLREAILHGQVAFKNIRKDWDAYVFIEKFESILGQTYLERDIEKRSSLKLPVQRQINIWQYRLKNVKAKDFIPPVVLELLMFVNRILISQKKALLNSNNRSNSEKFAYFQRNSVGNYSHSILKSFSWSFEDLLLDFLVGMESYGTYVDVGANNPKLGNNTFRFYLRGWRGINIEPNKIAFKWLESERALDVNLNYAISDYEGYSSLKTIENDTSVSELSDTNISRLDSAKARVTKEDVNVTTLTKILDRHLNNRTIDFMTIDTEGNELSVLMGNDWSKYRPALIVVEANRNASEIVSYLESQNYLFLLSNSVNAFFMDKQTANTQLLGLIRP